MKLVKWDDNWADEMDICGFVIMTDEEYKEFNQYVNNIFVPFEISVGTNEELNYENGEDFLRSITVKEITEEETKVLDKFFKNNKYGHTSFVSTIEYYGKDEDE